MTIIENAKIDWHTDTPLNVKFHDPYFSLQNGEAETQYVFLQQNDLVNRFKNNSDFVIAETGFGTGLNFLVTANEWLKNHKTEAVLKSKKKSAQLTYFSVEKYPLTLNDLKQVHLNWPQYKAIWQIIQQCYPANMAGYHVIKFLEMNITLVLMIGDVLAMLGEMQSKVDAWFFDGFSPSKNESMWQLTVFEQAAALSKSDTTFSTFTAAGFVRRNLLSAGFSVEKRPGFGKKRELLCGKYSRNNSLAVKKPWFILPEKRAVATVPVLIIGAGLVGITTASALADRGISCLLIDSASGPATGASGNKAGIILPKINLNLDVESRYYCNSFLMAINKLAELKHLEPNLQWQQSGVYQFVDERRFNQFRALGISTDFLKCFSSSQLQANPELAHCRNLIDGHALFFPSAGYISPPQLCRTMLAKAIDDIHPLYHTAIAKLTLDNATWQAYDGNDKLVCQAENVVVCNAYDAGRLLKQRFFNLEKNRGQLSYLPENKQESQQKSVYCADGYITPAIDGLHVIGATYGGESVNVERHDHELNLARVNEILPDLYSKNINEINGCVAFRAVTRDHLPLVGPVPDEVMYLAGYKELSNGKPVKEYRNAEYRPGLYVNTGHGSRGLVSCFSAADYLASLIAGQSVTFPEEFSHLIHPARFLVRDIKRNRL